jgi:hypothetical protein
VTIATCSYRAWREEMGVPIRTSVGAPRAFPAPLVEWPRVWPPWSLVRAGLAEADYRRRYRHLLHRQTPAILRELEDLRDGYAADLVFLCFCDLTKPGGWCHRSMLAGWITEHTGETIPELGRR